MRLEGKKQTDDPQQQKAGSDYELIAGRWERLPGKNGLFTVTQLFGPNNHQVARAEPDELI